MSYNGSKYCEFCGNLFDYVRSSAKYCSDTCKTKAYNLRTDERQAIIRKANRAAMLQEYRNEYPLNNVECQASIKEHLIEPELSTNFENTQVEMTVPSEKSTESHEKSKKSRSRKIKSQDSEIKLRGYVVLGVAAVGFLSKKAQNKEI